jgi:arylsulfatase A-like enzyme
MRTALLSLALLTSLGCSNEPEGPKSVIFISIDTLRRDHVGAYGYERDTTPKLDEIAKESMVFEQAYTTMSWTLIAHMSMLTGLYPSQHGVWKNESTLPANAPILTEILKDEGYHTLGFYKPGWLDPRFGYGRGFDHYESHDSIVAADEHMRAAMATRPKDKPLFLFIHLFDVHNAEIEKPGSLIYKSTPEFDDHFNPKAREIVGALDAKAYWYGNPGKVEPEVHDAIIDLYDGGIRHVDDIVGTWIEEWDDSGLLDDSILVITSDHGEGLRQRGGRYGGHGGTMEEGLLVPLFIRMPGGQFAGVRVKEPVSHVDLAPTILDKLGIETDANFAGVSLNGPVPRDRVLTAERTNVEVLIQYPWKIRQARGKKAGMIWNLEDDPGEMRPIRAKDGMAAFIELAQPVRDKVAAQQAGWFYPEKAEAGAMTQAELDRVKQLGYNGGEEDKDDEQAPSPDKTPPPSEGN